ncbi:hypothetical protein EX30DRAFT_149965 [Ascodesmis nigricans]|uniref:Uncharacterized protein n=1 Tax=Ascodesmis nigricans TaxID=341454 RepID=A0A4S2N207_9PEZI|nr:hypothetical protein EX30DRAFT_149965 [Ascodesmis nigricans]
MVIRIHMLSHSTVSQTQKTNPELHVPCRRRKPAPKKQTDETFVVPQQERCKNPTSSSHRKQSFPLHAAFVISVTQPPSSRPMLILSPLHGQPHPLASSAPPP